MDEKIFLISEDGEEFPCYLLEETRVAGCNYVLVTDSEGRRRVLYFKG